MELRWGDLLGIDIDRLTDAIAACGDGVEPFYRQLALESVVNYATMAADKRLIRGADMQAVLSNPDALRHYVTMWRFHRDVVIPSDSRVPTWARRWCGLNDAGRASIVAVIGAAARQVAGPARSAPAFEKEM